jgi:pullulanase
VKLHYSAAADLVASLDAGLNGTAIELEEIELSDEQKAIAPHLANLHAFHGEWSAEDAKQVLKAQAVLASYDSEGMINGATGIQIANVLDQLYTTGEADANEAPLGPIYVVR